ncbi:hypothetical protein [Clostridium perfringens]|uniref:hypothetical protein n=1 Tax=Clostridium perfringens TaxID=1502 RepID=UPI0024BD15B7|nr:hypothetical protein [Clostridium perfringens]
MRFETLEQLIQAIENGLYSDYIKKEINDFFGDKNITTVKNENDPPTKTISFLLNDNDYEVGITSKKIDTPVTIGNTTYIDYQNYYWLL